MAISGKQEVINKLKEDLKTYEAQAKFTKDMIERLADEEKLRKNQVRPAIGANHVKEMQGTG